jgi:hypothetical protein
MTRRRTRKTDLSRSIYVKKPKWELLVYIMIKVQVIGFHRLAIIIYIQFIALEIKLKEGKNR